MTKPKDVEWACAVLNLDHRRHESGIWCDVWRNAARIGANKVIDLAGRLEDASKESKSLHSRVAELEKRLADIVARTERKAEEYQNLLESVNSGDAHDVEAAAEVAVWDFEELARCARGERDQ